MPLMHVTPDPDCTWTLAEMLEIRGPGLAPVAVPQCQTTLKPEEPTDAPCGTRRKYEYGRCRCDECRAANRAHKAKYR